MILWMNGALLPAEEARIDPRDRGFTLGDGLFETLVAENGHPVDLAQPVDRLAVTQGSSALGQQSENPQPNFSNAKACCEQDTANFLIRHVHEASVARRRYGKSTIRTSGFSTWSNGSSPSRAVHVRADTITEIPPT